LTIHKFNSVSGSVEDLNQIVEIIMDHFDKYQKNNNRCNIEENTYIHPAEFKHVWEKKILIIINPAGGKGKAQTFYNESEASIKAMGFRPTVILTPSRFSARDKIKEMGIEEFKSFFAIAVFGGDGTISEIISGFYNKGLDKLEENNCRLRLIAMMGGSAGAALTNACKGYGLEKTNDNSLYVMSRQNFKNITVSCFDVGDN